MKINFKNLREDLKKPKNLILTGSLVLGLLFARSYLANQPAVHPVEIKHLKQFTSTIVSTGQIRAGQEAFLTIRTGGRLDEIKISQGQPVKKDDIILMVDMANNRAGLERALSRYQYAASEASRGRRLLAAAAGTRQEFEETQNALTVARSDLEQARQKLEDSIIRAPADGVVTLIAFKVGDFIPDGSRVAVVEDHTSYEIVTRVPIDRENDLPKKAEISLTPTKLGSQNVTQKVEADIESLAALASMISQDFDAKLRFSVLPEGFKVKDQVQVSIPIKTYLNVDVVKLQSVFDIQTEPKVLTLDSHRRSKWMPVKILDVVQDDVYIQRLKNEPEIVVPVEGMPISKVVGKKVVIRTIPSGKG